MISDRPRDCQLIAFRLGDQMKRRRLRVQNQTLTKIDPDSLKPKPFATSQHATSYRGRATLSQVQPPLAPPPEPTFFNADPLDFVEDPPGEEDSDDDNDVARGYYAASVRRFFPLVVWFLMSVVG